VQGERHRAHRVSLHPDRGVDLAVLSVEGHLPCATLAEQAPVPGDEVVAGGTGVVARSRKGDRYLWSGRPSKGIPNWVDGTRTEAWARGALHSVEASRIEVAFGNDSFAGAMSDSGSPLFTLEQGACRLAGIAYNITGQLGKTCFGDRTLYLRTDIHRHWIEETLAQLR
jgi:hypothetical protein